MRDEVIKERWLENWFEEIKPWNEDPAQIERFVWLECYGMPPNSWNVQSFKVIANKWGQFLKVDEDTLNGNSFDKGKLLIVIEIDKKIEDQVQILVNGDLRSRMVKEKRDDQVINGGSRKILFPRPTDRQLEPIMEEKEESFVDESLDMGFNGQVGVVEISENSNHKKYPEEYWKTTNDQDQRDLNLGKKLGKKKKKNGRGNMVFELLL
ncbi:hypothetical protein Vadar_017467 [Vaccinium darrowii]|uniref:Uncharacterized protein n=1 Tax=Vaccinium darrowii TaxID=229202 RepID=A0ACB7X1N6_9ERIC|nr:hypothetical protein Vadar_017467 [Vaccinium darrowii]